MERGRDWRRAQQHRALARVRGWLKHRSWWTPESGPQTEAEYWSLAARRVAAPQDCSGPCCGNPRRHFGAVSRQELRCRALNDEIAAP